MNASTQPMFSRWQRLSSLRSVYVYAVFLLLVSFGFSQTNSAVSRQNMPSVFDVDKEAEIVLDTDWEFYYEELLSPRFFDTVKPTAIVSLDSWTNYTLPNQEKLPSFGYATYRLQFFIPENRPSISLYVPAIYSASKLFVNGKLVGEIGGVGASKSQTFHRRTSQLIPLDDHETEFEIVIQVANFYHHKGGIDKPLIVGTTKHMLKAKSKRIIADMIFIGSLSFIGLFFLLFFLFYWNKDRAVLYFAILCISLAYMAVSDRYAPLAEVFKTSSWVLLTVIEYIALFLAGAAANLFFYTIFSKFVPKLYAKIVVYSFIVLVALAILLPAPHFTRLVLPFLIAMIVNLVYVSYIIIKAITSKRHESILLLTSTLLASLIFYAHIFIFLGTDGNTIVYVNFGYIIVFLLLSMLLMTRFSDSFHELEQAKEVALTQKEEIAEKSKALTDVNQELKENLQHLEKMNAELDSFNHIVSHDLKAPLIAINTLASFIEEDLQDTMDEKVQQRFQLLKDRVSKMYALINDLLAYAKITKGAKETETFSLYALLNELIEVVNPEHEHEIVLSDEDMVLHTNKIELKHVFQNLMQNAIKHNDKDKAFIQLGWQKSGVMYEFFVKDNGPGIEPKYHGKIFEMFSQLHTSSETESTGIGLSIVKKIVTENHGAIQVDSEKDIGTTIRFSWKV